MPASTTDSFPGLELPEVAAGFLANAADQLVATPDKLSEIFPQLPRRIGKGFLAAGRVTPVAGGGTVEQGALRACDAAAISLLAGMKELPKGRMLDLFQHGDQEERIMVLRALAALPLGPDTGVLMEEVQRTNHTLHVEAGTCDSDLLLRATGAPGFGLLERNKLVLKMAFIDMPIRRCIGWESLANEELSRMLQDLATEREAAGRGVWRDTCRMIARAPAPGTAARLAGAIEHGDDDQRAAAAEGLAASPVPQLLPFLKERLDREPKEQVRTLLQTAIHAG